MNVRSALTMLMLATPLSAWSQGFAGLGATTEDFALPAIGTEFQFPRDHGPHPDFKIEWWYVTANISGLDGTQYGLQWTLFRSALRPGSGEGWQDPQLWMGHAAVTTPRSHFVAERLARGGIGQAGVETTPFEAWIDDWQLSGASDLSNLKMKARGLDFGYDVDLEARGPLVFHGEGGYSVKSDSGQASYYYSQPFFDVAGTLFLPNGPVEVTGTAWLDREWSSQPLAESQNGWDWFSLVFDDGARLMGFRLRDRDGSVFTSATWIAADGTSTAYSDGAFSAEPMDLSRVADVTLPTRWQVTLPDKDVMVTVTALNDSAWMDTSFPYWEGPVTVEGTHPGRGYLEMTGYTAN